MEVHNSQPVESRRHMMMMNAAQVKTTESMILYRTSYSIYDSGFQTPYTLFFYKEPVYKEPTCRRPKYLKNLYY